MVTEISDAEVEALPNALNAIGRQLSNLGYSALSWVVRQAEIATALLADRERLRESKSDWLSEQLRNPSFRREFEAELVRLRSEDRLDLAERVREACAKLADYDYDQRNIRALDLTPLLEEPTDAD